MGRTGGKKRWKREGTKRELLGMGTDGPPRFSNTDTPTSRKTRWSRWRTSLYLTVAGNLLMCMTTSSLPDGRLVPLTSLHRWAYTRGDSGVIPSTIVTARHVGGIPRGSSLNVVNSRMLTMCCICNYIPVELRALWHFRILGDFYILTRSVFHSVTSNMAA